MVRAGKVLIADTVGARRVLETASPPTFYLPPEDVDLALLAPAPGSSACEWKGQAEYVRLDLPGHIAEPVGWLYAHWKGRNYGVPTVYASLLLSVPGVWRADWLRKVGLVDDTGKARVPQTLVPRDTPAILASEHDVER